jgi:hypothetical protein
MKQPHLSTTRKHLAVCLAACVLCCATASHARSISSFFGFGQGESQTTVAIRPDGAVAITNIAIQSRSMLEIQVSSWERFSKMDEAGENEEDSSEASPPEKPATATNTLSNAQLETKVKAMFGKINEMGGAEAPKLDRVEFSSNTVRLVTIQNLASLKEMFASGIYRWGPSTLGYQNARLALDTNQNLSFTFLPPPHADRYLKNLSSGWKSSRTKWTWKLILPGNIISSGLPHTEGNATWVEIDAEKPETLTAAAKLPGTTLTITATPSGLAVAQPLDARQILKANRAGSKKQGEPPVVDAGPGFVAEASGVSITTTHLFPEGERYRPKDSPYSYRDSESQGTTIHAKLFPPKERQIRGLFKVKVLSAKDDQGRPVTKEAPRAAAEGSETEPDEDIETDTSEMNMETTFNSDSSEKQASVQLQFQLGLPAADAKTIEELEGEVIVQTIGGWKEMTLTNVTADTNQAIDLSELLPGARLVVKKIGGQAQQTTVDIRLEGTNTVSQLDIKIKSAGEFSHNAGYSETRGSDSPTNSVRNLTLRSFSFSPSGEKVEKTPPSLILRLPQDARHERVRFKLANLDLL